MALHSLKMGFVPLICRCYQFLYIRLPFTRSFWEVPKHALFASQKKREVGLSWVWYTILFFFSKAVVCWITYYNLRSLIQEQRVSFFNFWCHSWLLECHFFSLEYHSLPFGCHFNRHFRCHSEFSFYLFTFLVHFFLSTFGVFCPPSS